MKRYRVEKHEREHQRPLYVIEEDGIAVYESVDRGAANRIAQEWNRFVGNG